MKFSIRFKIFTAYVLFIFGALVVVGLIIIQLNKLDKINSRMEKIEFPKIIIIKDMKKSWNKKNNYLTLIRYGGGILENDETIKKFADQSDSMSNFINRLYKLSSSTSEKEQVNKVKEGNDEYDLYFTQYANVKRNKIVKESTAILGTLLSKRHKNLQKEIDVLLTMVTKNNNNLREKSLDITKNSAIYSILSATLLLVIGITLASFLATGITGPLRRLTKTINSSAEGDFKTRVVVTTKDEVGELALAFNQMNIQLGRLDEIKADFISHASHELRTPVAALKNATQLLIESTQKILDDKQSKLLAIIKGNTNRLSKLINNLLDVVKLESDQIILHIEPTEVQKIIKKCILELEPLARIKKIKVLIRIYGTIPHVKLDKDKIEQVIANLLSNAIKFTKQGGKVSIEVEAFEHDLETRIIDTGIGIPKDKVRSIFDKFQQVKDKDADSVKGSGLGLTISKLIIDAHGGKMWVDSDAGKGSTFFFTLPKRTV